VCIYGDRLVSCTRRYEIPGFFLFFFLGFFWLLVEAACRVGIGMEAEIDETLIASFVEGRGRMTLHTSRDHHLPRYYGDQPSSHSDGKGPWRGKTLCTPL
jgi:hypothetical protein